MKTYINVKPTIMTVDKQTVPAWYATFNFVGPFLNRFCGHATNVDVNEATKLAKEMHESLKYKLGESILNNKY